MGSTWGNTGRRSWSDGKRQRIESALNGLAAGLIKAAAVERECRLQREKRERERAEEERCYPSGEAEAEKG